MRRLLVLVPLFLLVLPACIPQPPEVSLRPPDGGGVAYWGQWANGLPTDPTFFPVGVFNPNGENGSPAAYAAAGVNVAFNWYRGVDGLADNPDLPAEINASGLYSIVRPDSGGTSPPSPMTPASLTRAVGFITRDEPDAADPSNCSHPPVWLRPVCAQAPNGAVTPASIAASRSAVHAQDPTRPYFEMFTKPVALHEFPAAPPADYVNAVDAAAWDFYPITDPFEQELPGQPYGSRPLHFWDQCGAVQNMRAAAGNGKPVWPTIETSPIFADNTLHSPTPAEVQAEVLTSAACGATGIVYFKNNMDGHFPDAPPTGDVFLDSRGGYPAMVTAIGQVDAQLRMMALWLNSPYADGFAAVDGNVNVAVHEFGTGVVGADASFLVLATPKQETTQTIVVHTTGVPPGRPAVDLLSGATFPVVDGAVTVPLAPFQSVALLFN